MKSVQESLKITDMQSKFQPDNLITPVVSFVEPIEREKPSMNYVKEECLNIRVKVIISIVELV